MTTPDPQVRTTRARTSPRLADTTTFAHLSASIKAAGLLERRRGFYITLFSVLMLAFAGAIAGMVLLGNSWFVLIIAGVLGIVLTQLAFLAHEASHRQVFASGRLNDAAGKFIAAGLVGMSYSWWMNKHSRHHANPNQVTKDPDIDVDTVAFIPEDAARSRGFIRQITTRQGYLFLPLLLLEGLNLHYLSFRSTFGRDPMQKKSRTVERILMVSRVGLYLGIVFWLMPIGIAFAFIGVQLAVFGFYMGASFAPNHIGMKIVPVTERLDFLRKQVLTSRDIRGGMPMSALMGGLNHQVVHHLFPSMPRPHLAKAREMVRRHCIENNIPYTEATLREAFRDVIAYMHRVGLAARDPFACPMVQARR